MKAGFLEKLIEKVDRVEPGEVQGYLVRLMQEKGFLERVFDALQEGVIVTDNDGEISYINRSACGIFGIEEKEAIGVQIGKQIPGLDWESLVKEHKVVSRDLEVFYPQNRFLNFYLAPIDEKEVSADVLGYVMIIRDISEHRRQEEEKIESETLNALTMLAAGVAHEIGNPLNSLNIHLQLAERKLRKAPPEVQKELGEIIEISRSEIKRLDFIVGHFLKAIRPTKPLLEPRDLNKLLQESLRFLEPEIKDRNIEVRLELANDLPKLRLDEDQAKQAFYNLVRNANQAMGNGGLLRICTEADDYSVIVRFIDNGVGISAEDMANVFQPYYTTKRTGSGLGLLIVRRIVRDHGGEIELESTTGTGTSVTCYFPRAERRLRLLESSEKKEDVIEV
ncbi:MAG: two-component system, sporulation sensor kinase E [Verrucomicrobiales bacterium]|jgi:two-component system, sporulation sensor kinase E